jgi:hypothetical protein
MVTERNHPERERSECGNSSPVPKPSCHRIVPPAALPPWLLEASPWRKADPI